MNDLLYVPRSVSEFAQSVYNWFKTDEDSEPKHRKTFYGATEEIHDDIVYDYMARLQTIRRGHAQVNSCSYINQLFVVQNLKIAMNG